MCDETKEIEPDDRRQFRFARLALAKDEGDLDDFQRAARRENEVDENFEAFWRKRWRIGIDDISPGHEKAAHRVRDFHAADEAEDSGAEIAEPLARGRKAARDLLVGHARADRKIVAPARKGLIHFGQFRLVMLQIAVDDGDEVGAGGQPSFDDRPARPTRLTRLRHRMRESCAAIS